MARLAILGLVLLACLVFLALKYVDALSYPINAGGGLASPHGHFTARSLAIVERPFLGKEHRYYRFELREGGPNNGQYGRVLKEVTMEPIPGEEFLMPRGSPAFSIRWSDDETEVTFSDQGIALTLQSAP
jgi:hypothetical protein